MTYPTWVTPVGSLGDFTEGTEVSIQLDAGTGVTYSIVSGKLPSSLSMNSSGLIFGSIAEVAETTVFSFTVRAKNSLNKITDRGFSMNVAGPDSPLFVPAAGILFEAIPSAVIDYQIESFDLDPNSNITYSIVNGSLPTGLKLTTSGRIIGILGAPSDLLGDNYRTWNYYGPVERRDTYTQSFTVEINDGTDTAVRTFAIKVLDFRKFTCDSTLFTVDSTYLTADAHIRLRPIFLTEQDLGILRHSNYLIYPIRIYDPDGQDELKWELITSQFGGYDNDIVGYDAGFGAYDVGEGVSLPQITIDRVRGILNGLLPTIPAVTREYSFLIRVSQVDPDGTYVFNQLPATLTLRGDIELAITWNSPSLLGSITVGEPSQLSVQATTSSGVTDLYYKLVDGKLPPGIILTSNGMLAGTGGKRATEFDDDTTQIDSGDLTMDRSYTFTVQATNAAGTIQDSKTFTVLINRPVSGLFYDYYVKGLIADADRSTWRNIVSDSTVIRPQNVYRLGDPNFGINHSLDTLIAKGIKSVDPESILQALNFNHGKKVYYFGDIKTVVARNPRTNAAEYEVVYVELIDPRENQNGSVALSQFVRNSYGGEFPLTADTTTLTADNTIASADNTTTTIVFPNSTTNMRYRLDQNLDTIETGFLPTWMRSLQEDTRDRLGYVKAAVLCYVKPGQGGKTVKLIKDKYGLTLNQIHYQVDRYYVEPIYAYENPTTFNATFDFHLDSEITNNKYFVFQNDRLS